MAGTSSQDYFNQLNQYAADPNAPTTIENTIKKAYEGPVGQLINEGNQLRSAAYSGFFNAFNKIGTGAADLSPAAALSAAINQGELAMSPYRQNQGLRDYYGTSINDLVGKGLNAYQTGYGNLKDLYNMAFQREQAAQQLELERAKLRAAIAASQFNLGGSGSLGSAYKTGPGTTSEPIQYSTDAADYLKKVAAGPTIGEDILNSASAIGNLVPPISAYATGVAALTGGKQGAKAYLENYKPYGIMPIYNAYEQYAPQVKKFLNL